MTVSLAKAFVAESWGPRVVALEVPRSYRDAAAEEVTVPLARHVRCSACLGKGCARCERVGWYVEQTTATVLVPHGATPGQRITVVDAADVFDGVARPLLVEIVEPGPRADELRAAQADFEGKLETAWEMDRAALARKRRRELVAGAAVLALLAFVPIARWYGRPGAGEPCTTDGDCRSGHCLELTTLTAEQALPRVDGHMCTASCSTDLDCPSSMHCRSNGDNDHRTHQIVVGAPAGLACVPASY